MRELLTTLDALNRPLAADVQRQDLIQRLATFRDAAQARAVALHQQLATAQDFANTLTEHHRRLMTVDPRSSTRIG
jgi:histidinol dehydrogenase